MQHTCIALLHVQEMAFVNIFIFFLLQLTECVERKKNLSILRVRDEIEVKYNNRSRSPCEHSTCRQFFFLLLFADVAVTAFAFISISFADYCFFFFFPLINLNELSWKRRRSESCVYFSELVGCIARCASICSTETGFLFSRRIHVSFDFNLLFSTMRKCLLHANRTERPKTANSTKEDIYQPLDLIQEWIVQIFDFRAKFFFFISFLPLNVCPSEKGSVCLIDVHLKRKFRQHFFRHDEVKWVKDWMRLDWIDDRANHHHRPTEKIGKCINFTWKMTERSRAPQHTHILHRLPNISTKQLKNQWIFNHHSWNRHIFDDLHNAVFSTIYLRTT